MNTRNDKEQYPLDGVKRPHHVGGAAVGLLSLLMVGASIFPPPRPALAAPIHAPHAAVTTPSMTSSNPVMIAQASPSPPAAPSTTPAAPPGAAPSTSPAPVHYEADTKRVEAICTHMEHLNPSVKDWTSEVTIEANIEVIGMKMPVDLKARAYHKAPDRYKFELQNAPAMLARFQNALGYHPISLTDWAPTLLPDDTINGRLAYVVRLDKKSSGGDLRSQTVWIDKEDFTSPRRLYLYTKNGKVDVSIKWRKEQTYTIIDQMDAQIEFPGMNLKGVAKALYGGYQFNKGLDDSIFTDKKVGTR